MKTRLIIIVLMSITLLTFAQSNRIKNYYKTSGFVVADGTTYKIAYRSNDEGYQYIDIEDTLSLSNVVFGRRDGEETYEDWREKFTLDKDSILSVIEPIMNKYNFDIYNHVGTYGDNLDSSLRDNEFSMRIYVSTVTGKIIYIYIRMYMSYSKHNKAFEVPIEAYDEINKAMKEKIVCPGTDAGKEYYTCTNTLYISVIQNNNP